MLQCKTSRQDQAISSSSGSSPTINRPEPQRCGTPTADSPIVVAGPNVPQRLSPPTTDGRDRCLRGCEERATTYSVPASYRPGPVGKQAMTRCLLRRGPLHCTPLTARQQHCGAAPPPCCLLVTYTACQPKTEQKGFKGQASVSPSRTCTMSVSFLLVASRDARTMPPDDAPKAARPRQDRRRREAILYTSSSSSSCGVFCWRGVVLANFFTPLSSLHSLGRSRFL